VSRSDCCISGETQEDVLYGKAVAAMWVFPKIVEEGAGSSLQTSGVWLPKNTFVWLVEIMCEDKDEDSNDTGRSYLSEENRFRIRVKF